LSNSKLYYRRVGKLGNIVAYCSRQTTEPSCAAFGIHHDGKSHTGSCIFGGDSCISATSSKQKMASRDSTDAELIGLSDKISDLNTSLATKILCKLDVMYESQTENREMLQCTPFPDDIFRTAFLDGRIPWTINTM
jgi:hypothetical protein